MRLPDLAPRQWAVVGLFVLVVVAVAAVPLTGNDDSTTASAPGSPTSRGTAPSGVSTILPPSSSASPLPSINPTRPPAPGAPTPAPAVPTGPADPADLGSAYCANLLTAQGVVDLTGHPMGPGTVVPVKGTQGCAWAATDDSQTTVQATNASSSLWAVGLQALATSLQGQGVTLSDLTRTQLATAQSQVDGGQEVDADLACKIFQSFALDSGRGVGVRAIGAVLPSEDQPRSIVVEACSADEYSFMQVNAPDLARDLADQTLRTKQAVQLMHGAPLKF